MDFPQYRRRFDNKSFYKLLNERTLEEVQLIGNKAFIHQLEATQYFEILRLQEILNCEDGQYFESTEEEYMLAKNSI
jgi:uncharacterized protein YjcR